MFFRGGLGIVLSLVWLNGALWAQGVPPAPRPWQSPASEEAPPVQATRGEGGRLAVRPVGPRTSATQPVPRFVAGVAPRRPRTGYHFGVFGGANLIQHGDARVGAAPLDRTSSFGGSGGLKFGYDWAFDEEPIDQFKSEVGGEGFRLSGGLEVEGFYFGLPVDGRAGGNTVRAKAHAGMFALNALMKLQAGSFRPYGGPGVGLVVISGDSYRIDGTPTNSSDTEVTYAFQALVGTDYFFKDDWSLFLEYRYLMVRDVGFMEPTLRSDDLFNHFLNVGIRKHF